MGLVVAILALLVTGASFVVLVRASLEREENADLDVLELETAGLVDDQISFSDIERQDVRFLLGYVMEFAMALLVYYPIGSLVLFSGILGCGRLPILGGRPRDCLMEKQNLQKELRLLEI